MVRARSAAPDAGGDAARGVHAHVKNPCESSRVLLHHAVNAQLVGSRSAARRNANESAPDFAIK